METKTRRCIMTDYTGSNTPAEQRIWKPIHGYEGLYEACSSGEIRSVDRLDRFGRVRTGKQLKLYDHSHGYSSIGLCKNGVKTYYLVHRIVASTFIGEPPDGFVANHINGNKKDNRVENLEWCSMADNNKHAHRMGLNYISEKNRSRTSERMKKRHAESRKRKSKLLARREAA
ncbi:NUMOD4 motif-containing HNH endonuclease [Enterobacter kobei]